MKILHITTGLENGGAENLLVRLVGRMERAQFENVVVSLTDEGPDLGARIRRDGVPLHCLGFRRGIPDPRMLLAVARSIDREKPDIMQTWMYHADMAGAVAQPLTRHRAPLIWGLHNVALDTAKSKTQTVGVTRLNARLSRRYPDRIVCCSDAVRADHAAMGYAAEKMRIIPNGIDTDEFVPDSPARVQLRQELGVPPETPLIGLVARFDPQKDHPMFFRAAGLLHQKLPDAHFVLCGREITPDNAKLRDWAAANGVQNVTHLLGLRRDTAAVTAALDVGTCCSSFGESFALVLGEAMSCGVPVVTTDMAGPVSLVGPLGSVVPIGDATALAETWHRLLALSPNERDAWGRKARVRIADEFSLTRMVHGYEALYRERFRFGASVPEGEMACR